MSFYSDMHSDLSRDLSADLHSHSDMQSHTDMQKFYDRWASQDPVLHLSPMLPDGFLFRSIKSAWFESAENAADLKDSAKDNKDSKGQIVMVRETEAAGIIVQYLSQRTGKGWTRHIVAFRQGEESPFPLS
jgi:hypothetical protein